MSDKKVVDFSKVKPGDTILTPTGCDVVYVAGPDKLCTVVVNYKGEFRQYHQTMLSQKPVCHVEDRPVYVGDTLWYSGAEECFSVTVTGPHKFGIDGVTGIVSYIDAGTVVKVGSETWAPAERFKWEKPRRTITGWINIFYDGIVSNIHRTKEDAIHTTLVKPIDTIKITYKC